MSAGAPSGADRARRSGAAGAAQALQDQTGVASDPGDARYRRESLDRINAALGDEQLQSAHAHGMALSFDQAIDLAIGQIPAPDGSGQDMVEP